MNGDVTASAAAESPQTLYQLLSEAVSRAEEAGRTVVTKRLETTDESGVFIPI